MTARGRIEMTHDVATGETVVTRSTFLRTVDEIVVTDRAPSGTFSRASRRDGDTIVLGPSAPTPEAALAELGPTTIARTRLNNEPAFRPSALVQIAKRSIPQILLLTLPFLSACASLNQYAARAEQVRREAAAFAMALDSFLDECEALQEPRPAACREAERIEAELEPYVDVRDESDSTQPHGGEGVP